MASEQPDDTTPSPERQSELEAAYQANTLAGRAPYKDVRVKTRGEMLWIMLERGWSGQPGLREGQQAADFSGADLTGSALQGARLAGSNFADASLLRANLTGAQLADADFSRAVLFGATFLGASMPQSQLSSADLGGANLTKAVMPHAQLRKAVLIGANLTNANLGMADLTSADLEIANLSATWLVGACLEGANLRQCSMDVNTRLGTVRLNNETRLADVVWSDAPLTQVSWEVAPTLGDEADARRQIDEKGDSKDREVRRDDYARAARAYRQLAVALRSQGMNDDADRYAYRAQLMQRTVLRLRRRWGAAFGSWLLDLISGYGYQPIRSVFTYALVILTFAAAYFALTNFAITPFLPSHSSPLAWYEALVLSISSFHGRGLFPTGLSLGDPIAILAAVEAIIGLLIEITFIATFTQRFFAR